MSELVKIAGMTQTFDTVAFVADDTLWFDTPSSFRDYKFEADFWVVLNGNGGGRMRMYGSESATGNYYVAVDGGAPILRQMLSEVVGGALAGGTHHILVKGTIFGGDTPGPVGIELGLNTQPGPASLTRLRGGTFFVLQKADTFE